ncbi:MAG: hypothetical protein F6J98_46360 [Moorea sp. SIO4G2]|nr:hypothetical protein [Moorena sp. SIO4G2]
MRYTLFFSCSQIRCSLLPAPCSLLPAPCSLLPAARSAVPDFCNKSSYHVLEIWDTMTWSF